MKDIAKEKLIKRKKIIAIISVLIVLMLALFLTYFIGIRFMKFSSKTEDFRDFIQGYGAYGVFVAIGLQVLQVFIALIPGEVVEIGVGYVYGWFYGTLICLLGVSIGSSLIFLLVKKFGMRILELFVSAEKINELKFINTETKLKRVTFLLFFIPGTPKDLITWFVGLTPMNIGQFLTITLFARIPSIVSSAIGGNLISNGEYLKSVILFVVLAIISLICLKLYTMIISKLKKRAQIAKETLSNLYNKRKQ